MVANDFDMTSVKLQVQELGDKNGRPLNIRATFPAHLENAKFTIIELVITKISLFNQLFPVNKD